ncbi:TldD protein, part of TldE/TldD proteolytic complex [Desulfurella amilsii]|uniref:TldD protein, part of TldE/TldD proteolytic complex n=1 Tax=Desulfurella amilsii TaxID=1562698 RepID=A0A1X4XXT0_9BACT|nr:TldD/PmbA family protein [Desulfurella amilsii]OSS42336.1 TldD protein, part of TldE/TldD proteolytic complex [Desulfurella amilsii]
MYEDSFGLLKNAGFDFFDIYMEDSFTRTIESKNRQIENVNFSTDKGVGIRGVKEFSTLFASTNNTSQESVYKKTKFICDVISPKEGINIVEMPQMSIYSYKGYPTDLDSVKGIIDTVNTIAYKSPYIIQASVTYSDKLKEIAILNEEGNLLREKRTYTLLYIELVARLDNILQTIRKPLSAMGGFEFLEGINFETLTHEMVEKVEQLLKSPHLEPALMSVVLDSSAGGTMIHEAVGHGLEADLVFESMSVYKDKLGTKVANEKITVVDDACVEKARGSFVFDDEGTHGMRKILIKNGVLNDYMFDKMYAKANNRLSNGGARRQSYAYVPIPRMSNTYILPGNDNKEAIIGSIGHGLLVKKMGGGQVNPVTGDFVFEVSEGYLIEKGKVKHMVRGATLIGNGPKILQEIDMVGDDFGTEVGTCGKSSQGVPVTDGEPTLRIPKIMIGG